MVNFMNKSTHIKNDILKKVEEYYIETQKEKDVSTVINYSKKIFDHNELQNSIEAVLDMHWTAGRWVKSFENKLKTFLNVKYTYMVNSGSSANLIAFHTLTSFSLGERRIKRGDEVITVACCFPTTVSPIILYGAIPVFVDVDLNANIDITQLEKALSNKTKAVMIAHTLGNPFNIEVVESFCKKNNLFLISDCCDALGSKYKNKSVESYGDISTSSFYPAHHIGVGQGGAVHTNNKELSKIIQSMIEWGRSCNCDSAQDNKCGNRFNKQLGQLPFGYDHKYCYDYFSFNVASTDLQASIGVAQLDKLPSFILKRKENYRLLYNELYNFSDHLILSDVSDYADPSWFSFLIILKDNVNRHEFINYLEQKSIQTRPLFAGNFLKHPAFESLQQNIDYRVIGELTNTDLILNKGFFIGCYPGISISDIYYIVDTFKQYFKKL